MLLLQSDRKRILDYVENFDDLLKFYNQSLSSTTLTDCLDPYAKHTWQKKEKALKILSTTNFFCRFDPATHALCLHYMKVKILEVNEVAFVEDDVIVVVSGALLMKTHE